MDTQPMPLEAIAAAGGGLDSFRLATPTEIASALRRLQDDSVLVNLNGPQGSVYTTSLWTSDPGRDTLAFAADASDPQLQAVLEGGEAVAVAYLDKVRIQFDVGRLVLVRGARSCALTGSYPRELFRVQRRESFRVRPLLRDAPLARLAHPMIPDMALALRILDLSVGGCALLLPQDVPMLAPGILVNRVQLELDATTRLETGLRLHHVTSIHSESSGVRLGCEIVRLGQDAERTLQRYIDRTQKRRRALRIE
ncbi:MAG TPA: flagellar brake protein [Burkholderiaceae bacterium]|nr:flagellar brake protein [Burkholderiaceae bacterium]